MNDFKGHIRSLILRWFEWLLRLYPPRFRGEFSGEIRAVFLSRLRETEDRGGVAWFWSVVQEVVGLVISILRERRHELRTPKERTMLPEDQPPKDAGAQGGMSTLRPVGSPGVLWFTGWTLLTTAALPAALIAAPSIVVIFIWLINLGVKAGFWHAVQAPTLQSLGYLLSLALVLASVQWYLLRNFLPRAGLWFIATAAGVLLGGLAIALSLRISSVQWSDPIWFTAAVLLPFGLTLGLAQWLYIRRFLPNAFWIIFIDVLATTILFAGQSFESLAELIMVLILPGAITGLGLLLLLSQSHPKRPVQVRTEASRENGWRLPRLAWAGLGIAVLVPLFFVCIWVYAASQLALAKNGGIYPTAEEAVIGNNSQGWGGAKVISIENVQAGPNRFDGTQPHVWFGGAKVYLDRVPLGGRGDWYLAGSYYIHVRDGWVFVPEGAFPEFIGWVMELYHMEGVNQ